MQIPTYLVFQFLDILIQYMALGIQFQRCYFILEMKL